MSDLEWYLDVGGKQSGPHTAKEIVELVRSGRIPPTSQVTAARMSGDWVKAQDLVDAYSELYAKQTAPIAQPIQTTDASAPFSPRSGSSSGHDPNFQPPPRPTEQLERSKIIVLNREGEPPAPDPTDALFQAIQAVREKSHKPLTSAPAGTNREGSAQASASASKISPQVTLLIALAIIAGITVYGASLLFGTSDPTPPVANSKTTAPPARESRPVEAPAPQGKLLGEGGMSRSAVPAQRKAPPPAAREGDRGGGGARYRDERDNVREERLPPEDMDVDYGEDGADGEMPPVAPQVPNDPSQISPERPMIDPATLMPGAGGMPPGQGNIPPNGFDAPQQ